MYKFIYDFEEELEKTRVYSLKFYNDRELSELLKEYKNLKHQLPKGFESVKSEIELREAKKDAMVQLHYENKEKKAIYNNAKVERILGKYGIASTMKRFKQKDINEAFLERRNKNREFYKESKKYKERDYHKIMDGLS